MLLISWGLASEQMPASGGENVTLTVVTTPGHLQNLGMDTDGFAAATPPWRDSPDQPSADTGVDEPEPETDDDDAGDGSAASSARAADALVDDAIDHVAGMAAAIDAVDDDDADDAADDTVANCTAGLMPGEDAAFLPDGTPLSPESTRRLGCDAWLVVAIIDSAGALLDIGRRSRIVPAAMRRALIVRDGGCAFPGCGRPPSWCHAHHIRHWSKGGPTALHNLVLVCTHHHHVIHHDGWAVQLDHRGLPVFTPPRWIDPDQVPRPAWRPITILRT